MEHSRGREAYANNYANGILKRQTSRRSDAGADGKLKMKVINFKNKVFANLMAPTNACNCLYSSPCCWNVFCDMLFELRD